jgi:glycosyltransferase involved in cell wall biosynthesis
MRISFVLPFSGHQPVGGFKVAYEYANGLARRGHEVAVFHSPARRLGETSPKCLTRQSLVYAGKALGMTGGYRPDRWFRIDPRVRLAWRPSLHYRWLPPADAVVATSWETAEWVDLYPKDRGRKYYLIQHQESTFPGADPDRAMATWKMPFTKIVISRWLADIATELAEPFVYIPNGLDFTAFDLDIPVDRRDPLRLIMLYHHLEWKGSRDGLAALYRVKREVPKLKVSLFGLPDRPDDLPEWIDYLQNPHQDELRRIYNEAAIFVGPSWAEGWPLPPAEAAQCGAALCLTDIGGHREYGIDGETALLSPAREPEEMAKNILKLVAINRERIRLALRGHEFIRQFTWERAVTSMEKSLMESS